jgi:hypothetical protein
VALSTTASPFAAVGPTGLGAGRILIGFADALSAPECAWSLLAAGHTVAAFAKSGSRPPLRRCKEISIVEMTCPKVDLPAARADFRRLLESGRFSAVMPLDDDSVWLCSAAASERADVPVLGPTGSTAQLTLDKRLQLEAATAAGFAVPPTKHIESVDDIMALSEFPTVLKPALAIVDRGNVLERATGRVCANRSELARAAQAWTGEPLLAQPLISGSGEGLFGIAGPTGLHALSAHRRIRMMNPQGSGSSACASAHVDPAQAVLAEKMLLNAGWRGLFMLEFLRDKAGTRWFMELNGRSWGSMALARRAGLEYPAWAMEQLRDDTFEPPATPYSEQTCRHLGRELIYLLMVMRGPRSVALTDWPPRFKAVREVFRFNRKDGWYNWRPDARAVFFDETVRTVLDQIRRAVR